MRWKKPRAWLCTECGKFEACDDPDGPEWVLWTKNSAGRNVAGHYEWEERVVEGFDFGRYQFCGAAVKSDKTVDSDV